MRKTLRNNVLLWVNVLLAIVLTSSIAVADDPQIPLERQREVFLLNYFWPDETKGEVELQLNPDRPNEHDWSIEITGEGTFTLRRDMLFHNASDIGYHIAVPDGQAAVRITLVQQGYEAFTRRQEHGRNDEWQTITIPLEHDEFESRPTPRGTGELDREAIFQITFFIELLEQDSKVLIEPFAVIHDQRENLLDPVASKSKFDYVDFEPMFEPKQPGRRFVIGAAMPNYLHDLRYHRLLHQKIPNLAVSLKPHIVTKATARNMAELADWCWAFTLESSPYLSAYDKINRDDGWEIRWDGYPGNEIGRPPLQVQHNAALGHPSTWEATRSSIEGAGRLGCYSFLVYDWVWMWYERWGWNPATIDSFRASLNEDSDTHLRVRIDGEETIWTFWDYFELYSGFRFEPADLGYESWDQFMPIGDLEASEGGQHERRRLFVYTALYHYEMLKFSQLMGDEAARWGMKLELVPNPEDLGNGGDYLGYLRLAAVGNLFQQSFYSPIPFFNSHFSNRYLRRIADDAGTEYSSSIEISFGGHGISYFDPELYYILSHILSSSSYKDHMRHVYYSIQGPQAATPGSRDRDNHLSWTMTAAAFNFADEIGAQRPPTRIASIVRRSVLGHEAPMVNGLEQRYAFNLALASLGIDFDICGFEESQRWLDEYDVVFVGAAELRKGLWEELLDWAERGGTIITHSFVPASVVTGEFHLQPGTRWAGWANRRDYARPRLVPVERERENDTVRRQALEPGQMAADDPAFQRLDGHAPRLGEALWVYADARPLLRVGEQPIVTETRHGDGRIIHIGYIAGEWDTFDIDHRILDAVCDYIGMERSARASVPVFVLRYQTDAGEAVVLADFLDMHELSYRDVFSLPRDPRIFPYERPETDIEVSYRVNPGRYTLFNIIDGRTRDVTAGEDGAITLRHRGRLATLWYIIPAGDDEKMQRVREQHEWIQHLLDPASAELPQE